MKRYMLPAFLCFSFIWTFPVPVSAQLGWLWNWGHRKPITITGSTAGAQTNYQVKVTVGFVAGRMNADFSDIRFTSADGAALLDHWRESYTPSSTADFWVEVPAIPASPSTARIYLYYGNPSAVSASSGPATFNFFDDFSGTSLDTSRWTEVIADGGIPHTFSEDSGYWKLRAWDNGGCADLYYKDVSKWLAPNNQAVRAHYTLIQTGRDYGMGVSLKMADGTYLGVTGYTAAPAQRVEFPFAAPSLSAHYFDFYGLGTSVDVYHDSSLKHTYDISGYPDARWSFFLFFEFTKCLNSGTASEIWWDDSFVRNYVSPEPAAGAPGPEEFGGSFFQLFE